MHVTSLPWLALVSTALAAIIPLPGSVSPQASARSEYAAKDSKNIPLMIWHGLGDAFDSDGMQSIADLYRQIYPDSLVYMIHLGDDGAADRRSSFLGNLTEHVNNTCNDIKEHPELAKASATNALGFSQGGVFLRALVERCNIPQTRNLVTFGSPHNGINTFAECADTDWLCQLWSGTLKSNTWGDFAQGNLVPAQYFRDPEDLENYLEHSNFLADVNNEREKKNGRYAENIAALDNFIMYQFEEEEVVHPPSSTWFAEFNTTTEKVTHLKDRILYKEDWLGLRKLDEKGGLHFRMTKGKHMHIEPGVLEDIFNKDFALHTETVSSSAWHKADGNQKVLDVEPEEPQNAAVHAMESDGLSRSECLGCHRESDEQRWRFFYRFLDYFQGAMEETFA